MQTQVISLFPCSLKRMVHRKTPMMSKGRALIQHIKRYGFLYQVILLLTLCPLWMQGQQNSGLRAWTDGPLTWEDFKQDRAKPQNYSYRFYVDFVTETVQKTRNDTIFRYFHAKAVLDNNLTFIQPQYRTMDNLRLFQLMFDAAELECRKFRRQLHAENRRNFHWLSRTRIEEMRRKMENYMVGSFPLPDPYLLDMWEQNMDNMLRVDEGNPIPSFRAAKFGMGYHLSLGFDQYPPRASGYFSPVYHIGMGFDLIYQNWYLLPYYTVGFYTVTNESEAYPGYEKGSKNTNFLGAVAIGYRVADLHRWTAVPFGGISYFAPGNPPSEEGIEHRAFPDGTNLIAGFTVDRKFNHKVNFGFLPNLRKREYSHNAVRLRLFGMYNHGDHLFSGTSLHLSLAWLTTGRRIYVD